MNSKNKYKSIYQYIFAKCDCRELELNAVAGCVSSTLEAIIECLLE